MRHKKAYVGALALGLLASFSVGASLLTAADSEIDASKFTMYKGASVRTEGTAQYPKAQGLRFMTYATEFKTDLEAVYSPYKYDYSWYTQLRFKLWDGVTMDGSNKQYTSYTTDVPTSAWHADGWNTVLLNIPTNAVAVDITAQSFVEVKNANGNTVYEMNTEPRTYSAAEAASWALAYNMWTTDTQKQFLESYVEAAVDSGEIQALNLSRPTFGVEVGGSDYLVADTLPFGYGITYTSANENIAKVDGNGRVTGVAAGTTTITLSVGSLTKTCKVTVVEKDSVPAAITSWSGSATSWNTSKMYPLYKGSSFLNNGSGSAKLENSKIKVSGTSNTAYYTLNSEYLEKVFALSKVKAVRIKLTGLSNYRIGQFFMSYKKTSSASYLGDDYIRYEQDGGTIWLQFNRSAYELYLNTRYNSSTAFEFRLQFQSATGGNSGSSSIVNNVTFYVEEVSPIYDSITEDFEFGANSAISTDPESAIEKISERTNGRGMYAMSTQPAGNTLTVNIASAYVNKVFNSGATTLQFRVYTDKDLASVSVNGSTANVQYVYNADGEYYTIRIGSGYSGNALSVVLTGESALEKVYLDAFTGTNNAIGENRTKSAAYAPDNGGTSNLLPATNKTFNFFAYSSLSNGITNGNNYAFDEPTLEDMLELKAAGFDAIMPQSYAAVTSNGQTQGIYNYTKILNLAEQAGLKVILTDNVLNYLSAGKYSTRWASDYASTKETSGDWTGAAVKSSAMYNKVKAQLQSYINHPAFGGVVLIDEPHVWMFDESLPSRTLSTKEEDQNPVSGTYGVTYKTIKRVAQEVFGKDIYIHANLLPFGNWTNESYGHIEGQRFPELTVVEYQAITGMTGSYAVDSNGYATNSSFYTDLEDYIDYIGSTSSNNTHMEDGVRLQIQRARYIKYCEKYLEVTGADYLMADIYPVLGTAAAPTNRHLLEMQTLAEIAARHDVELHLVTQTFTSASGAHATQRQFTENDARWLNNILLSYGVKNIVYYTYHVRTDQDCDSSFVDETGEKTDVWYFMQQIMSENKAFASTYQTFDIQSMKTYYTTLARFDGEFGEYIYDVNFGEDAYSSKTNTVTFTALTKAQVNGEFTTISEYKNAYGAYMYAIMNMTDGKYASDYAAYQTTTLTFGSRYTHVILWRNGEKKLVALDENHSLEIENAAGEAVYVIPYVYKEAGDDFYDAEQKDNGAWFPGSQPKADESEFYDGQQRDNGAWFPSSK